MNALYYSGFTLGAYKSAYMDYVDSNKSASQLRTAKPLPQHLPVFVLSAKNENDSWTRNQLLLAILTKKHQILTDTGHSVHLENLEIVIDSIE